MKGARRTWGLFVVMVALAGALVASAGSGDAGAASSFPCRWTYDLQPGLRAGYVTAGNSADCGGRSGSLTLRARLLRWEPKHRRWHTDRAQTRTWSDLGANRYIELAEPCRASTVRAAFGWILRDSGGAVVARNSVRTASLKVPGPGCKITLR